MNSPTHSLIALALLSKQNQPRRNWAIFFGSIIPDAVIYLWAPYQAYFRHRDWSEIWNTLYFQAPMQNLIAYVNSAPIYTAMGITGYLYKDKLWGQLCLVFSLAALLHIAFDLPFHNHDAYRHFWPISDWRFFSPLSYYETAHHAKWVSLIEAGIATVCMTILWRRYAQLWVKVILSGLALLYVFIQFAITATFNLSSSTSCFLSSEGSLC